MCKLVINGSLVVVCLLFSKLALKQEDIFFSSENMTCSHSLGNCKQVRFVNKFKNTHKQNALAFHRK